MGEFEVKQRKNGEYHFNLKAGNGQVILTSEGYATKAGCMNGISSVRVNCSFDARYELKQAINLAYYFNLRSANGLVIGTSEMYTTAASRGFGIASVKLNGPNAVVVDTTIR